MQHYIVTFKIKKMEDFVYNNIFETKGIEYIVIILFLLILIPFWIFVNKFPQASVQIKDAIRVLSAGFLRIPQGILFHKNHTWAHLEKSGEAKIGIDDFLLRIVGEVKVNQLKFPGETIQKGEVITVIHQNGNQLCITSPISGEIVGINQQLTENSELLSNDPYEKGWFYLVKPVNWKTETSGFYLAGEATGWISKELERFKDFLNVSLSRNLPEPSMLVLQEGGEILINPLAGLQQEIWEDFQNEFLMEV